MQHVPSTRARAPRFVAVMLALLMTLSLPAGAADAETPEAFVTRSVKTVQQKGMGALADFMHPDELARFKGLMKPFLQDVDGPGSEAMVRSMFGPNATVDSVRKMPPVDFMRNMLDATMSRPGVTVKVGDSQILGSVREGETIHLVTRSTVTVNQITMTNLEVVSVRPYGDSWGMLLTGSLEGMADAMRAMTPPVPDKPDRP